MCLGGLLCLRRRRSRGLLLLLRFLVGVGSGCWRWTFWVVLDDRYTR